jgi:elongation factor Ts
MNPVTKVIESYVHNGRVGVLIELGLETTFTAQMEEFTRLAKDLAVHVAAAEPETVEALLQQPFAKDPAMTVGQLLLDASNHLGERITITRFVRWDSQPVLATPPDSPSVAARLRSVR